MGSPMASRISMCIKVLAVACIVILLIPAIVSNGYTPSGKLGVCQRKLWLIRDWLREGESQVGVPFGEWQERYKDLGLSLKGLMCEYCQQSYRRFGDFGKDVVPCRKAGGEWRFIDPWGNEYNIDRIDSLDSSVNRNRTLRIISVGGFVVWSSGPNGIDERGVGDDLFEMPRDCLDND